MPLFAEEAESADGFETVQKQLAAWIRDPENAPAPAGIEPRRLEIYRNLFYNNIESFIVEAFPRLHSLYSPEQWRRLVRSFIAAHTCRSPYFREISREFLVYLEYEHWRSAVDPPFLLELAHYEWVMQALEFADTEIPDSGIDPQGDLLESAPVVSPLVCSLYYGFAVQHFSRGVNSLPQEETFLFVYRNREDCIGFMESNVLSSRLLTLLAEGCTGRRALQKIAGEFPDIGERRILQGGAETLQKFRSRDIVLGTANIQRQVF